MNHSTNNLKHTVWECKYHVVFIPKYRKKVIYGGLRSELGPIFRDLAQQKEAVVVEGHLMSDHVHMLLSIPPKYSVSGVVGFIKGKSALAIARRYMGRAKNFVGQHFWARGYYVSTVGRDEAEVRKYIQAQEKEDQRLDQLKMFESEGNAGVAGQTALSGSQIKPPALPEVHDSEDASLQCVAGCAAMLSCSSSWLAADVTLFPAPSLIILSLNCCRSFVAFLVSTTNLEAAMILRKS